MSDKTILIIDDDPMMQTLMHAHLSPDYAIRTASSGAQGLEIVASEPHPDLILLDVMMPEMDGYSVLVKLKADPATKEIPIIFVSCMETTEDRENGIALGAVDYITKPINPGVLAAKVDTHLTRQ